jgi:hypothetical protein
MNSHLPDRLTGSSHPAGTGEAADTLNREESYLSVIQLPVSCSIFGQREGEFRSATQQKGSQKWFNI